jgi:hypothetical protein
MILHSFSSLLLSPIFYFTLLLSSVRLSNSEEAFLSFLSAIDTFYAIKEVEVEQESMLSFLLLSLPAYGMDMQLVTWIMI